MINPILIIKLIKEPEIKMHIVWSNSKIFNRIRVFYFKSFRDWKLIWNIQMYLKYIDREMIPTSAPSLYKNSYMRN